MDAYKTLESTAEGIFRDRNSRFLAFGFPVDSLDKVNEILIQTRKRYHDARHHCYAYRIGMINEISRMNDDGEPSGTAGKPIYNQILSHNITNILVIVVRYFGGTLLGTGGLINAYKCATGDMFDHASVVEKFIQDRLRLNFPYERLSAVMKVLKEEDIVPVKPVYELDCSMQVFIRKSLTTAFLEKLSAIGGVSVETLQSED